MMKVLTILWRYINGLSYPQVERRDLRIDLLRGFAVFVLVVNHVGGGASWLYLITGNNKFYVSGAEAFILFSGLVCGMVYREIALSEGLSVAIHKLLLRAWSLYKLTVIVTISFAMIAVYLNFPWAQPFQIGNPLFFVRDVIFLRQTFIFADVLLMYTLLMVAAPLGLWMLYKKHTTALLICSTLLWSSFQLFSTEQAIILYIKGNVTYHFGAWQLIFFWAMAASFHRETLENFFCQIPRWPYLLFSTVLFMALCYLYSSGLDSAIIMYNGWDGASLASKMFTKSSVGIVRIVGLLIVFQFAYLMLTQFWVPICATLGWLLLPLGQNALYCYSFHMVIMTLMSILRLYLPGYFTQSELINSSLQLTMVLMIWWLIRKKFAFNFVPR